VGIEYTFTTTTSDEDGDQVLYQWDWGDGTFSEWLGPFDPDEYVYANHTWVVKGEFEIKVRAKDLVGDESPWSFPAPMDIPRVKLRNKTLFSSLLEDFPIIAQLINYIRGLINTLPII